MRIRVLARTAALALVLGGAAPAFAQGQPLTPSELKHFEAGRAFVQQKRYAEAIPEFLASMERSPTVGGLLNVADCYERIGKSASAWARYREAAALAASRGDDRHKVAEAAATEIERRLPSLTVRVDATTAKTENLQVLVDGAALPPTSFNRALPVDSGEHWILVTGAKKQKLERRITVSKKGELFDVVLVDAPDDAMADGAPPRRSTQKTLGIVGLVAGGAALAAGAVFGLLALSSRQDLDQKCPSYPQCPGTTDVEQTSILDLNGRGQTQSTWATISLAAGAALGTTGLVLLLSAPRDPSAPNAPTGATISWRAQF